MDIVTAKFLATLKLLDEYNVGLIIPDLNRDTRHHFASVHYYGLTTKP